MVIESGTWEEEHRILGCYGCKYADLEALGKAACCTRSRRANIDPEGFCLDRVERKGERDEKRD